jgi:hypothetical protein
MPPERLTPKHPLYFQYIHAWEGGGGWVFKESFGTRIREILSFLYRLNHVRNKVGGRHPVFSMRCAHPETVLHIPPLFLLLRARFPNNCRIVQLYLIPIACPRSARLSAHEHFRSSCNLFDLLHANDLHIDVGTDLQGALKADPPGAD